MSHPASMRARRAELLEDVVSQTELVVSELSLDPQIGHHLGCALADHLAAHWGGQVLSFPKDASYRLSQREQAIVADHRKGHSIAKLAATYGMGERGIRKLLKRAAARDVDRDQMTLPI